MTLHRTRLARVVRVAGPLAGGMSVALGVLAAASPAQAQCYSPACPAPTTTYISPHYNQAQQGDIVVFPLSQTSPLTQSILSSVGQSNGHVAMVMDTGATSLKDSNWTMAGLGNSGALGSHSCSQPLVPAVLKALSPGIEITSGYGTVSVLSHRTYRGQFGRGPNACTGYGGYAFDRYGYNNGNPNGQCADYMVYGCGVPWLETTGGLFDANGNAALGVGGATSAIYSAVVNTLLPQLPWYASLVCGGVPQSQIADRGAMQFLNELFWGQGSTNFHAWAPTDSTGSLPQKTCPGSGTGAGCVNTGTQVATRNDVGPAGQPPCDDGIQYPSPLNYAPQSWPANVFPGPTPDKIENAYTASYGYPYTDTFNQGGWVTSCPAGYTYDAYYGTCDVSCTVWAEGSTGPNVTVPVGTYIPVTVQSSPEGFSVYWYGTHNGAVDASDFYDTAGPTPINTMPGPFNVSGDTYTRYAVLQTSSGQAVCTTNQINITIQ